MRVSMRVLLLLALFPSSSIAQVSGLSSADSAPAEMNAYLEEQTKNGFSGAVLVVRNDRVVLDRIYGLPKSDSSPAFWLASNSKPILAVAVLKLQEQGKLSIQDPLTRFFKGVPPDKSP